MAATLTSKPLAFFHADPNQPRKSFDDVELKALGESLRKHQVVPVLAKPDGTLIDGHRRLMAAKFVELEKLDVIVTDEPLTPAQIKEIQLVSAWHRAGLTPYEEYLGCSDWLANTNSTLAELAAKIDRDPSMLTRILSLSKCIPEVKAAAAEGKLSASEWYAIAKAAEGEQATMLAAKLAGATRDELERFQRNGEPPAAKLNRFKILLPGGTTVTLAAKDLTIDIAIEKLDQVLKAAKKARDDGLDAKTFEKVMQQKSKTK